MRFHAFIFLSPVISFLVAVSSLASMSPSRYGTARITISESHYEIASTGGMSFIQREVCRGIAQVPVFDLRSPANPNGPMITEVFTCTTPIDDSVGMIKLLSNIHIARRLDFQNNETDQKDFIGVLEVFPPGSANRVYSAATATASDANARSAGLSLQTPGIRSLPYIQYVFSARIEFED